MVRENSLPFLLNFTNESDNVLIMCVSLQYQPLNKVMTKKEEDELMRMHLALIGELKEADYAKRRLPD